MLCHRTTLTWWVLSSVDLSMFSQQFFLCRQLSDTETIVRSELVLFHRYKVTRALTDDEVWALVVTAAEWLALTAERFDRQDKMPIRQLILHD